MNSLRIAMVGCTGSELDIRCLVDAYAHLGITRDTPRPSIDPINLGSKPSRDFLKEDKSYDVVILCMIFCHKHEDCAKDDPFWKHTSDHKKQTDLAVSPLSTPENWRKRLLQSGASWIFCNAADYGTEVGYNYLGELEGYKHAAFPDMCMSVYTKI